MGSALCELVSLPAREGTNNLAHNLLTCLMTIRLTYYHLLDCYLNQAMETGAWTKKGF